MVHKTLPASAAKLVDPMLAVRDALIEVVRDTCTTYDGSQIEGYPLNYQFHMILKTAFDCGGDLETLKNVVAMIIPEDVRGLFDGTKLRNDLMDYIDRLPTMDAQQGNDCL